MPGRDRGLVAVEVEERRDGCQRPLRARAVRLGNHRIAPGREPQAGRAVRRAGRPPRPPGLEVDGRIAAPARERPQRPTQVERAVERVRLGGHRADAATVSTAGRNGVTARVAVGQTGSSARVIACQEAIGCGSSSSAPVASAAPSSRSPSGATSSSAWSSPTTTSGGPSGRSRGSAGDGRLVAARVDASRAEDVAALCREHAITPRPQRGRPTVRHADLRRRVRGGRGLPRHGDVAVAIPTPSAPYERTGVKLGDEQFAKAELWASAGRLALVGIGVEPGLSDIFARYAADHLFSEIDEVGVRDGANLVVDGYDFAPSFSIWTTIEECLNPPVIWEADRGWYTTPPFSEPEVFDFPEGIGPVECVNVEHEEVLLIPRWVKARAGDLQVRPRRRVHQRPEGAPHARAGPDGEGPGRRGRGVAAGRGGGLPAGPGRRSATG